MNTIRKCFTTWSAGGHLSAAEEKYAELLTVLIEAYEEKHYPVRAASPVEVLAELIAVNDLKQKDLAPLLGSESSKHHIEKLSQRLKCRRPCFF